MLPLGWWCVLTSSIINNMNYVSTIPFVIATELEKAAFENGYRIAEPVSGSASLKFASASVPGHIELSAESETGPWLLRYSHSPVIRELGRAELQSATLAELYDKISKVYRLSASLPDAPLQKFRQETAALPVKTEAEQLVVQRIGQNLFREALMDYWGGRCPITGIADPALLRASHIVPWAMCESDEQRLDVHNGLLLSALCDAAFDKGLIGFQDDGAMLMSDMLSSTARAYFETFQAKKLLLTAQHLPNLRRHREIFGFIAS